MQLSVVLQPFIPHKGKVRSFTTLTHHTEACPVQSDACGILHVLLNDATVALQTVQHSVNVLLLAWRRLTQCSITCEKQDTNILEVFCSLQLVVELFTTRTQACSPLSRCNCSCCCTPLIKLGLRLFILAGQHGRYLIRPTLIVV